MRVYVVDNGGQWTHREWRVLRDLNTDAKIIPNTTPVSEIDADALVLSGGAPRIGSEAIKLGNSASFLDELDIPILGICVGCQFIAMHFGGEVGPAELPEYGKTQLTVLEEDDLFRGLPKSFEVWESHNDEVKSLPEGFTNLASSDNCPIQAFKYNKKDFYAVQFHPEVEHTQHGYEIIKNFLGLRDRGSSQ
jgi:GMP synthase (glutamine-hydrolysing)